MAGGDGARCARLAPAATSTRPGRPRSICCRGCRTSATRSTPSRPGRLLWQAAIQHRWFEIAELLACAMASRLGAPPALKRLHAQMLLERGFDDEALARLDDLRRADDADRLRSRRGARPPGPDPQGPVRRRRARRPTRPRSSTCRAPSKPIAPATTRTRPATGWASTPWRCWRARRPVPCGPMPATRPGAWRQRSRRVSSAAIRRSTSSTARPPWPRRSWPWAMRRPPCNRWSDTSSTRRSTASPSAARCGSSPRSGGSTEGPSPARRSSTCSAPPPWSTWKARSRCPAATSGARARRCRVDVTKPCSASTGSIRSRTTAAVSSDRPAWPGSGAAWRPASAPASCCRRPRSTPGWARATCSSPTRTY